MFGSLLYRLAAVNILIYAHLASRGQKIVDKLRKKGKDRRSQTWCLWD